MRHFIYAEAAKEAHLDYASLASVNLGQAIQTFIEFDYFNRFQVDLGELIIEPGGDLSATTLLPEAGPRVIDENLSHQVRGDGQKVSPTFPRSIMLQRQAEICLVH
jgi:hypothetical protein